MLDRFAKLLGIRPDQAEDALRSERAAKHVVSRRSFFGTAGALTAGAAFSFAAPAVAEQVAPSLPVPPRFFGVASGGVIYTSAMCGVTGSVVSYSPEQLRGMTAAYDDYAAYRAGRKP